MLLISFLNFVSVCVLSKLAVESKFKIIRGKRHRYIKRRCFNDDPLRIRTRVCMLGLATHTYMQNPRIPETAVKPRGRGERRGKNENEAKQNEAKIG